MEGNDSKEKKWWADSTNSATILEERGIRPIRGSVVVRVLLGWQH